ncbi:MAG: hypothetical protein IKF64_06965 [Eubacterium sp.]|nr:hypothetical protein [Eubacterium sp.]
MPSNQRENARKEKQLQKERKIRIIIWAVLIIIAVGLAAMRVAEIDFSALKSRLTGSHMGITTEADAYPYTLDTSAGVKLSLVNDKLVALTDSSCRVLNPTDAKEMYSFSSGYANPIMNSAGKYLFTIDQGSTRIRLDTIAENVYENTLKETVICGDVAKNGNVIYACRNSKNKTELIVMNSALKKLVKLPVKDGYIVAVAIDSSGKRYSYAAVNSKDAKLVTTLYTFNLGDNEPKATFEYTDSNVLDLQYTESGELYYVANDTVHLIKSHKKDVEVFAHGSVNTVLFNYTRDGELVYVYSKYADARENEIAYVNSGGKVKTSIKVKQKPKFISATNDICVLFSDKLVTYSLTKGDERGRVACDDSVTSAYKISSKIFITRHQLIDVVETKVEK